MTYGFGFSRSQVRVKVRTRVKATAIHRDWFERYEWHLVTIKCRSLSDWTVLYLFDNYHCVLFSMLIKSACLLACLLLLLHMLSCCLTEPMTAVKPSVSIKKTSPRSVEQLNDDKQVGGLDIDPPPTHTHLCTPVRIPVLITRARVDVIIPFNQHSGLL